MFNRRLVRIKVLQLLYAHMSTYGTMEDNTAEEQREPFSLGAGVAASAAVDQTMMALDRSLQAYVDLEHTMLHLLVELRGASRKRISLLNARYIRRGAAPSENFSKNRVVQQIASNESLRAYTKQHSVGWAGLGDFVWRLYTTLEKESFYDDYLELKAPTYEDDRAVVGAIYDWLQDVEIAQLADEQLDESRALYAWALSGSQFYYTDLDSVLDDLLCTTETMQEHDDAGKEIVPRMIASDLRAFAQSLLRKSIEQQENNLQTLIPFLRNWDPSRVAFMDLLLLLMGLTEALNFPEIPLPVTINEYIELARCMSTQSSPQFINGVLDSTLKQQVDAGIVVKKERKKNDPRASRIAQ